MSSNDETGGRFEEQLARLEETVTRLEDESVGLEEALALFETGMELARACRKRLEEVEQRVTQILGTEGGEVEMEPREGDPS